MIQLPPSEYLGHTLLVYDLWLTVGWQRYALEHNAAQAFAMQYGQGAMRFVGTVDGEGKNPEEDARICQAWLAEYGHLTEIAVDTETTGLRRYPGGDRVVFWSMSDGHRRWTIPARNLPYFREFLQDPQRLIVFHNANFDTHMLRNSGIDVLANTPRWLVRRHDTMVAHTLVADDDPHDLKFAGPDLICTWNGFPKFDMPGFKTVFGKEASEDRTGEILFESTKDPTKFAKACDYASQDAWVTMRLYWEERRLLQQWQVSPAYGDLLWGDPHGSYTLWDYFCQFEMQMQRVCYEMELEGVPINRQKLLALREPLRKDLERLRGELTLLVGRIINPNSPRDLRWVFFGQEKVVNTPTSKAQLAKYKKNPFITCRVLPSGDEQWYIQAGPFQLDAKKRTKGGKRGVQEDSTDKTVLEELSTHSYRDAEGVEHLSKVAEAANLVLEIRKLSKVLSTNVEGVLNLMTASGRVHTTFNQQVARTGRLSSSDPNLQNVQARGDYGPLIRDAFEAPAGYYMVCPDYSQIEPRCTAAFSEDHHLVQAIMENLDVHSVTASLMYDLPYDWVNGAKLIDDKELKRADGTLVTDIHEIFPDCPLTTKELLKKRKDAKQIRLGLTYGMGPKKLAARERLNCTITAAKEQVRRFWDVNQGVRAYFDRQIEIAEQTGLVYTLLGRKRNNASVNSVEFGARGEGERIASNCVDDQTEALTQRGWVHGFDLQMSDLLLTKNAQTGRLEWQPLLDLRLFPDYEGPLVEFRSRSFSAVSNPPHRWLVRDKATGKDECRTTAEISPWGDHRIHRTGDYQERDSRHDTDLIELIGWVVTEGYVATNGRITITQSHRANPDKVARVDALMARLGQRHSRWIQEQYERTCWSFGGDLARRVRAAVPNKQLPAELLLTLSREQADVLLETMMLADGTGWPGWESWRRPGRFTRAQFHTIHENEANAFQFLATLCGIATTARWRDLSRYTPVSDKLRNSPRCKGYWVITLLRRTTAQVTAKQRREYTARTPLWCPVVANTYFVARRDRCVFITGNTPIQGSAGEIVKMAQIRLLHDDELWAAGVRQVLQVHDEVLFLVPCHVPFEWVGPKIQNIMEHPFTREPLLMSDGRYIPLHAKPKKGQTWMEAK